MQSTLFSPSYSLLPTPSSTLRSFPVLLSLRTSLRCGGLSLLDDKACLTSTVRASRSRSYRVRDRRCSTVWVAHSMMTWRSCKSEPPRCGMRATPATCSSSASPRLSKRVSPLPAWSLFVSTSFPREQEACAINCNPETSLSIALKPSWLCSDARRKQNVLEWSARQKIAVGAARGLRYLHEECRVGCIVHRDMRPNNILLTHDFEALVGDFGLARWQPDGDMGVETRVIGTFGYLAPEYAQSGQITEKADVYSFGIVLLELVTGRKAVDINRPKGQQCLSEWARPLLEKQAIYKLIDPSLRNCYVDQEVYRMLQCSSLCIGRDPHLRPRMSQVLRMLEGDILM